MVDGQELTNSSLKFNQFYFGHGKVLLTGEYFVLDGANSLALPTTYGQSMGVNYSQSFQPKLTWKSFDSEGNLWLEAHFEFWQFKILDENPTEEVVFLQKLLLEARKQNKHFLREDQDVYVETRIGFPLNWGLGSSSTLLYNVSQWAYISPFELLKNTLGGSGYDIACAQSDGPILYQRDSNGQKWKPTPFSPEFRNQLYFVYLGKKKNSREAIAAYQKKAPFPKTTIKKFSDLTERLLMAPTLSEFCQIIDEHEELVASLLDLTPVKKERFSDFQGSIKSLGGWGGDFALVGTELSEDEVRDYFKEKGLDTVLPYNEIILTPPGLSRSHLQTNTLQ